MDKRELMDLLKAFPHILFEGCASGGNRFDLGVPLQCGCIRRPGL